MSPTEKQIVREKLLLLLHDASPASLALSHLHRSVQIAASSKILDYEIERELGYLAGKDLITETTAQLSRGLKRWQLTAAGTDHLESEGLV